MDSTVKATDHIVIHSFNVLVFHWLNAAAMATALHPQTILAFTFRDQVLVRKYGFPKKLRVPTKQGFKNPKHIMAMFVTNNYPGSYWQDQGYNWFSGS